MVAIELLTGKQYFELLDKWETEKKEGITPLWKGEKYREFRSFFSLKNRYEAWQMLDMIHDYLESSDGLQNDASLIQSDSGKWALFPRTNPN